MEARTVKQGKGSTIRHNKGIVGLGPILPVTTPEMGVLWNRYAKENPGDFPINRQNYVDKFNKWYQKLEEQSNIWMDNLHSGQDTYRDEHLHPRIREKVESIGKGRFILDIGCGTGETVIPYLKPSQHYLGLDVSRAALEFVSDKYGIRMPDDEIYPDFERERMLRFGALPNAIPIVACSVFDEVLCSMVLQNVPDLEGSVRSISDLLFPGGSYFIVTLNPDRRDVVDGFFDEVHYKDKRRTVGDFVLPNGGRLTNLEINYHGNRAVFDELRKHSDYTSHEENGEVFSVFEGVKSRGN